MNADFESGFADAPEQMAANVSRAIATAIAGLSIEDTKLEGEGLHDKASAVARVKAARGAIAASSQDVLLVARAEILLHEPARVSEAIDKLVAFAEAGADCLYAPGLNKRDDIITLVKAVSPKPVNILMWGPGLTVQELWPIWVRAASRSAAPWRGSPGAQSLKAAEGSARDASMLWPGAVPANH